MKPWEQYTYKYMDDVPLYAQWVNQPASITLSNGRNPDRGGFFCEAKDFPGMPVTVQFSNGKVSRGHLAQKLQVAVIAWRFWWEDDNNVLWKDYAPGRKGKIQCIAAVRGNNGVLVPMGLTCRGMASKDMLAAIRRHRQVVAAYTSGHAPGYAFWMSISAGPVTRASKKKEYVSLYTPIVLEENINDDAFVGIDVLQALESIAWLDRWRNGGDREAVPNGEPGPADSDTPYNRDKLGWALTYPSPVGGKSFKKGTPMGELPVEALEYIVEHLAEQYPEAAEAAYEILRNTKGEELDEEFDEEDIPF